jgi:transposase-like protein
MARKGFTTPLFHDETAAREWFEASRWPNGPICPKCGSAKHYATKKVGRYRCGSPTCRKDFTVMTGTVMERSHAKFTNWAVAFHLAASSKKGFSAHQLHRELGCQYNTAWFMFHRVREAMRRGGLELPPLGGEGQIVEADETYFGKQENPRISPQRQGQPYKRKGRGPAGKRAVIALVERGGNVRSFHPSIADGMSVNAIVRQNIARESRLHTDESKFYVNVGKEFKAHETVTHSRGEYVRESNLISIKDGVKHKVHTNTVEGFFSIFKRGMKGVYQHCKEKHLHRYVAEFEFRYNTRKITDMERSILAVRGGEGKRLTYHQPN